jgi:hypothetical protein
VLTIEMGLPKMCVPVSTAGTPDSKGLLELGLNKTPSGWTGDGQRYDQGAKEQPSIASHSNCVVKAALQ